MWPPGLERILKSVEIERSPGKTEKGGKDENASNARLDKFSLANGYCP